MSPVFPVVCPDCGLTTNNAANLTRHRKACGQETRGVVRRRHRDLLTSRAVAPPAVERDPSWRTEAACRAYDLDLWFSSPEHQSGPRLKNAGEVAAIRICHACPVVHECLQYALDARIDVGIYGGFTSRERWRLLKSRRSGAAS